jgi:hypothetical protein
MRKNLANCEWHPNNAHDYSWFENPVYRDIFLGSATPEDLIKVQDEFAAGTWSVFGVWAKAIMSGKITGGFPDRSSPHSRFWSGILLKATPQERDEFLTFLLRAQMAHSPISDRPNRGPVPGFTLACRKALLDYLNAFEDPKHTPDPNGCVGTRLIHHSHLPDERMVHLAGQFQLIEAIPALERFLKFQRRIFQLHTDYCTGPEEVDNLFVETLRTLVRIGLTGPPEKLKATEVLKNCCKPPTVQHPKEKGPPGMAHSGKGETIWSETFNDGGRGGHCSHGVSTDELLEGGVIPLKREMVAMAMKALNKDGPERHLLLDGRTGEHPEFSWVLDEADGQGLIRGNTLFYNSSFILEAIDLPTGKTMFRFYAGQTNSNQGVGCYNPILSLTTSGDPLLLTMVVPFGTGNGRGWYAIVFDRETGEVKRSFKLAVEPERAYGPQVWPQTDNSILFRHEGKIWRQGPDGAVLWIYDVDGNASVRCAGGLLAVFTKKDLTLRKVEDFSAVLERPVTEFFKELGGTDEKEMREDMVLLDDRLYLFPRFDGPILTYDLKGNLLWKKKPEVGGYYLNHVRALGPGLFGDVYDHICKVSPEGGFTFFEKPSGMKDNYLCNDDGVFMQTDFSILYMPFDAKDPRTPVPKIPSQSGLIALSNDHLVVHFYENEHHLACLSKVAW